MANRFRGAVPLQTGDATYTLSFSVNALIELEDALGLPVSKIGELFQDQDNIRMKLVRTIIWAALRDHHEDVSLKDAGLIASEASLPVCMEAIGRAFQLAFPQAEAKDGARPPKAKAA